MKPTASFPFSLRWKILAWFFLNLALIGAAVFLLVRAQFRFGINSLLAGAAEDRLEAIAGPLAAELRRLPSDDAWSAALERATAVWRERGGVRAALIRGEDLRVAGDPLELPSAVRTEIEKRARPPRREMGSGPPSPRDRAPRPGPPPDSESGPRDLRPPPPPPGDDRPPPPMRHPDGLPEPPPDFPRDRSRSDFRAPTATDGTFPKFMLITSDPRQYWAGVYLGEVHAPERGGPPPPVTLLLASNSLSGGGLFFDYAPWLALGGGLALLSVLLWLPFVQRLTRALAQMTGTAEAIAQGRFDAPRVNGRRDEIGRLGRALGHMATRLDGLITGQKRFLGDTAHELLSPLARLEVALSILEERGGAGDDGHYARRALGEVRYLSSLVHDLLSFTKAGLRTAATVKLQPMPLAALVRETVAREILADDVLVQTAVPEDLRVLAEPDLLARALGNVLRNAARYAGDAGPIEITAVPSSESSDRDEIVLTVSDHGPGVPADTLDRLFDPFFRPEAARTRETGGTGLGLAIVKSCVEACGGRVAVCNRQPTGLQLSLTLPRA